MNSQLLRFIGQLLLCSLLTTTLHAVDAPRPNIVVILADDLGYADIGAHGCNDIPTPHIDRIAARGVRFTNAYANGSFCTPTRAALISCRYQHRYGIEDLGGPLPAQANTLPQRLKAAGYVTSMVGKWHLGTTGGFTQVDRGFDAFFGFVGGGHQSQEPDHPGCCMFEGIKNAGNYEVMVNLEMKAVAPPY